MPVKEYNKLVRDRIPEIIASEGKVVKYTCVKDASKRKLYLLNKLYEEVNELCKSADHIDDVGRETVIEEFVDVYEVLRFLKKEMNINYQEIEYKQQEKVMDKGTFDNCTYLIEVEEGE